MSVKKTRSSLRTRVVVSIVAGALALLAVLAGVVAARRPSAPPAATLAKVAKGPPAADLPQRPRPIANFESELITITPHGFEPRQITRPQGRFLLMIDNRSGLLVLAPRLTLGAIVGVREIAVPREQPNWDEVVDPPPGVYLLTEATHPRWVCSIVITAQ